MLPQEFVSKWSKTSLKESAASQEHFLDLCRMVGHPTPAEFDPSGETFTFEKGARKDSGTSGFADVWYKDRFGWEYKSKGSDLDAAYRQLLQYRDNLANPKLLVTCDFDTIEIHTNFNGTVSWVYIVTLDNIQDSSNPVEILEPTGAKAKTDAQLSGIQVLHACFEDPDALAPNKTTESLTEEAAGLFSGVAESLRVQWGNSDEDVAKYRTMGQLEQAAAHFEDALTFCRKAGYRPELAWSCHNYADALLVGTHGQADSCSWYTCATASPRRSAQASRLGNWFSVCCPGFETLNRMAVLWLIDSSPREASS